MSLAVRLVRSKAGVVYPQALLQMDEIVQGIIEGRSPSTIWFLEHCPVYTMGTSANENEVIDKSKVPIYSSGRGGKVTYHGPGQRIVYLMLDLKQIYGEKPDLKLFIKHIEQWLVESLGDIGVKAFVREGRVGVWVHDASGESKIAAIGIRIKKWVSFHGIALNIAPDLSHYDGIVPCGIKDYGVTSLANLEVSLTMQEVDKHLLRNFERIFNCKVTNETEI